MMFPENPRKYGTPPFRVVCVHGGPGAAGEMMPVCRHLAACGISSLETLQTASSVKGQLAELKNLIAANSECPVCLIGFSWGAWLSFIFAAEYPELIEKLIIISSGVFEEKYVKDLHAARMARLTDDERKELDALLRLLDDPQIPDKTEAFQRFGALFSKTDSFAPIADAENCEIDFRPDIYNAVWPEAAEMRKSGELMKLCPKIKCPVVAIHGDSDPHSPEGVRIPLSSSLPDFKFILLDKCGHKPWIERYAADAFYAALIGEVSTI